MRYALLIISMGFISSCKKTDQPFAMPDLRDTKWNLHYKYDGFSFFAQTELSLHGDYTMENIGVSDTVYGNWTVEHDTLKLFFDNLAVFRGTAISNDSLVGTMFSASTDGIWSAGRK